MIYADASQATIATVGSTDPDGVAHAGEAIIVPLVIPLSSVADLLPGYQAGDPIDAIVSALSRACQQAARAAIATTSADAELTAAEARGYVRARIRDPEDTACWCVARDGAEWSVSAMDKGGAKLGTWTIPCSRPDGVTKR